MTQEDKGGWFLLLPIIVFMVLSFLKLFNII